LRKREICGRRKSMTLKEITASIRANKLIIGIFLTGVLFCNCGEGTGNFNSGYITVSDGDFEAGYSFISKTQIDDWEDGDLIMYFDPNDCREGALFGYDDDGAQIYELGKKAWKQLVDVKEIPDTEPLYGFALETQFEGEAYILKIKNGNTVLFRVTKVEPSSYEELNNGGKAEIAFEWRYLGD
jgi:hypothetical protein